MAENVKMDPLFAGQTANINLVNFVDPDLMHSCLMGLVFKMGKKKKEEN